LFPGADEVRKFVKKVVIFYVKFDRKGGDLVETQGSLKEREKQKTSQGPFFSNPSPGVLIRAVRR